MLTLYFHLVFLGLNFMLKTHRFVPILPPFYMFLKNPNTFETLVYARAY